MSVNTGINTGINTGLFVGTTTVNSSIFYATSKTEYYVKGHTINISVSDFNNKTDYAMVFSMISLLGKKAYETFQSNGVYFSDDVEKQLKAIFREEKIDSIIK